MPSSLTIVSTCLFPGVFPWPACVTRLDELSNRTRGIEEYLRFQPQSRPPALPGMDELALPDTTAAASRMLMGNPMSTVTESFQGLNDRDNDTLPLPNGNGNNADGGGLSGHGLNGLQGSQRRGADGANDGRNSAPGSAPAGMSTPGTAGSGGVALGNSFYGGGNGRDRDNLQGSALSSDAISRGLITSEQAQRYFAL